MARDPVFVKQMQSISGPPVDGVALGRGNDARSSNLDKLNRAIIASGSSDR